MGSWEADTVHPLEWTDGGEGMMGKTTLTENYVMSIAQLPNHHRVQIIRIHAAVPNQQYARAKPTSTFYGAVNIDIYIYTAVHHMKYRLCA